MKHSRSSLFLMELIMAILFFSLTSAVCIRLFVRAHTISQDTINQNNALAQAQNLAEAWLAAEGEASGLTTLLSASGDILPELTPAEGTLPGDSSEGTPPTDAASEGIAAGSCYRLHFDSDWQPCASVPSGEPYYVAELTSYDSAESSSDPSSGHMIRALIRICTDDGSELYRLELVHHIAEKRGDFNE